MFGFGELFLITIIIAVICSIGVLFSIRDQIQIDSKDVKVGLIVFAVLLALGLFVWWLTTLPWGTKSSSSSTSAKCKSCGRTFSYEAAYYGQSSGWHDVNCINHTNMCRNCYSNFCYAKGMTPTSY